VDHSRTVEIACYIHKQVSCRPTNSGKTVNRGQCPITVGRRKHENRAPAPHASRSGTAIEIARVVEDQTGKGEASVVSVPKIIENSFSPAGSRGYQLECSAQILATTIRGRTVEIAGTVED